MEIQKTQFGQAVLAVKNGSLKAPKVSQGNADLNYFKYQIATHKFNLAIMGAGMKFKGITLTQLKKYYGLQGKSSKDVNQDFLSKYDSFIQFIEENN